MQLFTIGDSISQGFMSLAAARTDLSYSTLIAEAMGWASPTGPTAAYNYPLWELGGHPLNLEMLFRALSGVVNDEFNLLNLVEDAKAYRIINKTLDTLEAYYERGHGALNQPYTDAEGHMPSYFHNVAIRGYNVSDAYQLTAGMARAYVRGNVAKAGANYMEGPSESFFRTAARVLNPNPGNAQFEHFTSLDWLKHHVQNGGVENVVIWLGANNALATVVNLHLHQTSGKRPLLPWNRSQAPHPTYTADYLADQKQGYTLWHANDFAREYAYLLDCVDEILVDSPHTRVFIGNVPLVTIPPITRGMGREFILNPSTNSPGQHGVADVERRYFEYYTYFPFDNEVENGKTKGLPQLRLSEILFIENATRNYNTTIATETGTRNAALGHARYHVTDICTVFEQMAFRRNLGVPSYDFPEYIRNRYPMPDTRFYERSHTAGSKGGLFSLDGVHPTAIGQGLIAHEFMKTMAAARPQTPFPALDWEKIYAKDTLYNDSLYLLSDLYRHDKLKSKILGFLGMIGKG